MRNAPHESLGEGGNAELLPSTLLAQLAPERTDHSPNTKSAESQRLTTAVNALLNGDPFNNVRVNSAGSSDEDDTTSDEEHSEAPESRQEEDAIGATGTDDGIHAEENACTTSGMDLQMPLSAKGKQQPNQVAGDELKELFFSFEKFTMAKNAASLNEEEVKLVSTEDMLDAFNNFDE